MASVITGAPNPLLYDVIPMLLDFTDAECDVVNARRMIPIREVVAQAWNPGRLADCQRRLKAGETAPPIEAEQYCIAALTYYLLPDGNHRTIARRLAGKRKILAIVRGRSVCSPERTQIIGTDAWRQTEHPNVIRLLKRNLSLEKVNLLLELGAKRVR